MVQNVAGSNFTLCFDFFCHLIFLSSLGGGGVVISRGGPYRYRSYTGTFSVEDPAAPFSGSEFERLLT